MSAETFKREFNAMQDEAPTISKSLGIGKIPLFIGNIIIDEVLDVIDLLNFLEDAGYALVRKGATELWSLAEPIKKPVAKFGKSV